MENQESSSLVSGSAAGSDLSVLPEIEHKIKRRWQRRWEPLMHFQGWSENLVATWRGMHRIRMVGLLREKIEMRIITRNDWDDPRLPDDEVKEIVRCYRKEAPNSTI